ncbi:hypothetical protein ACB092_07G147700 [Castanea dentata]
MALRYEIVIFGFLAAAAPVEEKNTYPATQAPILTKPKRRKLQAMEIGSWFLAAAPVEEKNTLICLILFWVLYLVLFMGFGFGILRNGFGF